MTSPAAATATVAVRVSVAPPDAFEVFTQEMDLWWRRGPKYRAAGSRDGRIAIEPDVGGRVLETWDDAAGPREFELGRVTAWEPPHRLAFSWRNETFSDVERTEVEVVFVAVTSGTLVTVRHRGWEALRPDHPARHGLDAVAFARTLGLWWGEQLEALRVRAGGRAE